MTLGPKKRNSFPSFHMVKISNEAFIKLHERKTEEMRKGRAVSINMLASEILEGEK